LEEFNSEQIAAALMVLEGDMYSRIRAADCINHLQERQCPNRVAEVHAMTLKITFWVKQKVLHSDRIEERGEMLKFFLKIAEVRFS
jgi:RasGEF domain